MTSQTICEANVCFSNGGKAALGPPGCSVCALVAVFWFCAMIKARGAESDAPVDPLLSLEREQEKERDQQREDAERFGHGEPEDQVAELALRGRRVAQRGCQIVAEDDADADAGAAHADAGNAGPDIFRGGRIHENSPC